MTAAARNRLTNTENGLELRRWTVMEDSQRLAQALAKHVDGQAIDEPTQLRMKRNGFRFLRVPADQLETLLNDLGGATINANEWHGQVPEWRSLADEPVRPGGRAVAIDGRVLRYEYGVFRLMIRSWTVQMENGPIVHLEVLPQHHNPQTNDLRRLLKEGTEPVEGYGSMALDLQLQSGYAYVLLGESPQMDWPGVEAAMAAAHNSGGASASAKPAARTGKVGPSESIGPQVAAPLTMGELLLCGADRTPRTRDVLVFVPKIAPDLFSNGQGPAAPAPIGKGS